jgi:hypothetical protein
MARITTTLWDLAGAVIEEADRIAEGAEADALASAALADFLAHARFVREPARPQRPARHLRMRRWTRLPAHVKSA